MPSPVPVSSYPDEIVTRAFIVRRAIPCPFDNPPIAVGTVVYARRSPFLASARSYWLEDEEGNALTFVTEQMLRSDLEESHCCACR